MSLFIRSAMVLSLTMGVASGIGHAQAPRGGAAQSRPAPPAGRPKVAANLAQVMRGVVFPASNVVFAAQGDLGAFKPERDPSVSPNLLTSTYGGWQAVENASLALAESVNLILLPGRSCSNGKPAPVQRADWIKYAEGLRSAGLAAYKAAQSKRQEAMVDAAGTVADACAACHDVYREKKGGVQDRCTP